MMTIEQALAYWVRNKKLTKKKALELVDALPPGLIDGDRKTEMSHRAISIFSAIGAALTGLGVILFVASNWHVLTPFFKTAILLFGLLFTGVLGFSLAFERPAHQRTGLALLFVNALIYGATIFLIAQIYHLSLNFWWGALLWLLGTVLFALILESRLHAWLSVPLLLIFFGWLRSSTFGGSGEFDFFFDAEHSVTNLFPAIGLLLCSLSLLAKRSQKTFFASQTLFHWGIFISVFVYILTTFDVTFFYQLLYFDTDPVNLFITILAVAMLVLALFFGRFETADGKKGLIAYALYTLFTFILARTPVFFGLFQSSNGFLGEPAYLNLMDISALRWLYVLHVVLFFIFLLVLVWYGTQLKMPAVINIGMLGMAAVILVQYFSWAFQSINRSVAFILGGIVILLVSYVLERQRRILLGTIES